jgi:prefoldin subunit 5
MLGTPDEEVYVNCQEAAYVIEVQAKRIEELEKVLTKADDKMERLEQYMDRVQNLIAFFHLDIRVAVCKDKK